MRVIPVRCQSSAWHLHAKVKAGAVAYAAGMIGLAAIDHFWFPLPAYVLAAVPGALTVITGYSVRTGPDDV